MCSFDRRHPTCRDAVGVARRRRSDRRGQSLVEFALVALVMYLLLAAILTFGQIFYCAQAVQAAADVAARELSRTPLPADATLSEALQDPGVRARIFDERYLVLTIDEGSNPITFNGGHPLSNFPLVNQQLIPVMVYDEIQGTRVLRYPGAVFNDPSPATELNPPASGFLVRVPVVAVPTYPAPAKEYLTWVPVLEEVNSPGGESPFQVSSVLRGVVAVRVNYPYASATMSGFQPVADRSLQPDAANPVAPVPAESPVTAGQPPGVGSPVESEMAFGPNAGEYGLGQQAAWTDTVRPFRRVISAQAIFRREVFQ